MSLWADGPKRYTGDYGMLAPMDPRFVLSASERALLRDVRNSDMDHGGLAGDALAEEEYEAMDRLCTLGLVEATHEYGEAPDGEEDEREAGAAAVTYRVTGLGVEALRAHEHDT